MWAFLVMAKITESPQKIEAGIAVSGCWQNQKAFTFKEVLDEEKVREESGLDWGVGSRKVEEQVGLRDGEASTDRT